ncbi:hypothetical protein BDV06DRAFT_212422 [Aspergillus oleicola]
MESDNAAASPYEPEKEAEMEVIRVTSYHRRDFDLAVARTNPRQHDQVRRSLLRTINATSSTLGNLQILPLEIVYEICFLLDIQSLLSFRHVNRRAQQIVRTTRGYKAAITHALEALCVILKTNIASWFTLSDLFEVLCTRDCHFCGSFGGFIFLPLFMRCCFSCIREDSLPSILPLSVKKKGVKSSPGCLYSLVPTIRSLPGTYSMDEIGASDTALLRYMVTTALPYIDIESGGIQNGLCCSGCQIALERALGSTMIQSNACALQDKVYSHEEFMEHFREYREAQNLWELSNKGVDVANLSEFVKRGGWFKKRDVIMSFNSK